MSSCCARADIVGGYEDVWGRLRARYGKNLMPRTVNTITGPSRTGDIEQTMELGAHGPRRMHILVVRRLMAAGGATPGELRPGEPRPGELRVVGTSVTREVELLLDQVAQSIGKRAPRILQVGSRTLVADRNVRNWRNLVAKRFGAKARFVGLDLVEGANVDYVADICGDPRTLNGKLGDEPFDLAICCHVLEHTRHPARAARNIERVLRPGGLAYVAAAWSQAFHATPDDYWRFSARGLMLLFGRLEIASSLLQRRRCRPRRRLSHRARRQARTRFAGRRRRAGPLPARPRP